MNEIEIVRRWNQRFLYLFWFALGLYVILALVAILIHPAGHRYSLWIQNIVHPTPFLILLVGALQIAARQFPRRLPIFLVLGTYIAVYIIADALSSLVSPASLLVLPLMFATIYLRRDIIMAAAGLSLLELFALYFFVYRPHRTIDAMDLLVVIGILVVSAAVAFLIVGRGQELTRSLTQNIAAKQDLMMQNVWMQRMSKFDPLTELYNRAAFQDHITRLVDVCGRHRIPLHIAVVDIDDFKAINDHNGHAVGDDVLCVFARHLTDHLPEQFFKARYGGEEFVVVGTEVSEQQFVQYLEQFREQVSQTRFSGHTLTISIGIHSLVPGEDTKAFFEMADKGLYWSKNHGKNQVGFATEHA